MGKKWLYLPIEIKSRDLKGRLFFIQRAIKEGYSVILIPKSETRNVLRYAPQGVYIHYGVVPGYLKELQDLKAFGHKICAWDEEGLVFLNEDEYLRCRISKEGMDILEYFFAWGNSHSKTISKKYGNLEKVKITGHPRFDLLRKDYRTPLDKISRRLKEKYGDFILINTRFGTYNHYNGKEYGVQAKKSKGYFSDKDGNNFYKRMLEFEGSLFESFKKLVSKLAERFPSKAIIVRPHPSENRQEWEQLAEKYRNLQVNTEGNAIEWLLASESIIHNGCTTAVEAFLLDKNAIWFAPVTSDEFDIPLPNSLSLKASSIDEVFDLLESDVDQVANEEGQKIADEYIANYRQDASELILNQINALTVPLRTLPLQVRGKIKARGMMKNLKEQIRTLIKGAKDYQEHKLPLITSSQVIEELNQYGDGKKDIKVKSLFKNCFLIEGKHV